MKQTYIYIFTTLCFIFLSHLGLQAQGPDLANAAGITPTTTGTGTTNGVGPNFTFTGCDAIAGGSGYSAGCSVGWYKFIVAAPSTVDFDFQSTPTINDQDMGAAIFIANNCSTTSVADLVNVDCDRDGPASGGVQVSVEASPSRTYYIMVWDFGCNATVSYDYDMIVTALPATNDEACTATPLTIGGASESGTIGDYTASCADGDPAESCANSSNTGFDEENLCEDAWYSVVVPSDGTLQINVSTGFDLTMAAYTTFTNCNNLIYLDCDDDGGTGGAPHLSMTGLTPGATIYIRIWDFDCDSPSATYTISVSQAPILLDLSTTGTVVNLDCGVTYDFYDSGGPGITDGTTDYDNGENYTITFCADVGNNVRLSFLNKFNSTASTGTFYIAGCDGTHALDVDAGGNAIGTANDGDLADYLTFYDGNSSGASVIGVYTGETLSYPSPGTVVSSGQCLTVNFASSTVITEEGWEAKVDCIPDVTPQSLSLTCPGSSGLLSDDDYNDGGSTILQENDQWMVTVCPDVAGLCAFAGSLSSLASLSLNQNVDYLYVYNGVDDTSSPIAIFTGSGDNDLSGTENLTNITGVTAFPDYTPANTGGCLTFKLVTNNSIYYPDWTTVTGFDLDIWCVECDLGNGGGTECSNATEITQNGFWAGTSIDDTGNAYEATWNGTGTDMDEYTSGVYTNNCVDAALTGESNITRLENTIWYHFTTPDICEELNNLEIFLNYISCQNERVDDNGIQFTIWEGTPGVSVSCPADGTGWDNDAADGVQSAGVTTNDMFGCFDKLTAGNGIFVTGLESNTDYYIMIDGFTGQHCFFDIYIGLFPAELQTPLVDAAVGPANFCTGSTDAITLSALANADVEFVIENTAYTTLAAAQAAASGATAYDGATTSLGTVSPLQNAVGDGEVSLDISGTDFAANNTCGIQVYNVYAIADNHPVDPFGVGSDATTSDCYPFVTYQVVIYPTPTIVVAGDCELTFTATGCDITDFTLTVDGNVITQGSEGNAIDFSGTNSNGDMIAWSAYLDGMPASLQASCAASGTETLANCIATANIGDFAFIDFDNDGVFNNNDVLLAGVGVELFNSDGSSTGMTTTTNGSGNYLFTGVPAGNYYVQFTAPAGYAPSTTSSGNDNNNIDPTAGNCATCTATFAFDGATNNLTLDAGFIGTGSIGDFVWHDQNGDDVQDGGFETGVDNVTVELLWYGPDGDPSTTADNVTLTTITSGGGNYDFINLPPGTYEVDVTTNEPSNYTGSDPTPEVILGIGQDYNDADFGYNDPSLPVELLKFNGRLVGEEVYLDWRTVTEINSDYFSIERSKDGVSFRSLGEEAAAGFSNTPLDYDFIDKEPNQGMNYYRLKMIDRDETYVYSNTVIITLESIKQTVIFPSPTRGQLFINAKDNIQSISIFDANGRLLRTAEMDRSINTEIDVQELATGIYFIKVDTNSGSDVLRFMKQ